MRPKAELGIFSVAMVSTAAVFSVRNLPSMAVEGWPLILWYVLGTVLFLAPLALTAAELASTWPRDGGVYDWVAEAFGKRTGFMSVWSIALLAFYYLPIFAAVIRLRYTQPDTNRPFRIPGGLAGVWIVGSTGFAATTFAVLVALQRPGTVTAVSDGVYVAGMIALALVWMVPWAVFVVVRRAAWLTSARESAGPR